MNWLKHRKFQILADQSVFSGTSFLLTILTARHLDATSFGLYSAYVLAAYLAVSTLGAWTISVFQVAKDKTPNYVSFVFWWQIFLVATVFILVSCINQIFPLYNCNAPLLFGTGFVLYDFGRKFLLSLDKTLETLVLDSVTSILLMASFILFQKTNSKDIHEMLGMFAVVYFISMVILLFFSNPFYFRTSDIQSFVRLHITEGKWLFFTAVSQWWAGNLLVVASGVYLGATALGALRLAQSLFGVLNVLLQTFEHYVLPQTALHINNDVLSGIEYLRNANKKLGLAFVPVLIAAFVFAEPIMTLAGGSVYAPYAFVLRGLSILYVFIFLSQPIRFVVRSLQLNRHFFYAYLLNLGFALTTSQWLLSNFGLYGAIAGLIIAQAILILYWILILQQQKKINVWKSFISY